MRRLARSLGLLLIVAGLGALAWTAAVWQWQDPVTLLLNRRDQQRLAQAFERRLDERRTLLVSSGPDLRAAAARWRRGAGRGEAVARIRIPRLGLSTIVVDGTDHESLKHGPGRYLGSAMPGEGKLVYIAGHRTTYGAPFGRIDHLRKRDRVVLELPYATFTYEITGHRIVKASQTSVLESKGFEQLALQACHPRFFATHRYIAYAKPVRVVPRERAAAAAATG